MHGVSELTLPLAAADGLRAPHGDTLSGLASEVAAIVGDPGLDAAAIVSCLNRGLLAVAGQFRLPDLATIATVATDPGRSYVTLPADFQHGLDGVFLLDERRRVRLLPDLAALVSRSPGLDAKGSPLWAAVMGNRLYVQPSPDRPRRLEILYYRLPEPLTAGADKPLCLPAHLAPQLLASFACRELFERLEEGAEGSKVQTEAYGRRYAAALADLAEFLGPPPPASVEIGDAMGWGWLTEAGR